MQNAEVLSYENPMTSEVVRRELLIREPFTLIDVGCSGGIHPAWRIFGQQLRALGVDPMIAECERLNAAERNPNVHFYPSFMGLPDNHPFVLQRGSLPRVGNNPWWRLATATAIQLLQKGMQQSEQQVKLNAWNVQKLADPQKTLTMKQLVELKKLDSVDFIKIDIDSADLEVLVSCEEIFAPQQVLGVQLEVNFIGSEHPTDHTLHNTDRLMRRHGFMLADLTMRRYSFSALPAPFTQGGPGPGEFGPPFQGDALYLRDLACPERAELAKSYSAAKLFKLACLFEIGRLPDCAAEVFVKFADRLESQTQLETLLDLLVPKTPNGKRTDREYMAEFEQGLLRTLHASKSNQAA